MERKISEKLKFSYSLYGNLREYSSNFDVFHVKNDIFAILEKMMVSFTT